MNDFEKARYRLEQELLPNVLTEHKMGLLNAILDKEGKFFTDFLSIALGMRDDGYKSDDFEVYLQRAKSDDRFFNFLVVRLPKPTALQLADTLYLCCEETTEQTAYFTVERSMGNVRVICGVSGDIHENYGAAPDDPDKEFQKAANIFIRGILADDSDKK